MNKHNVSDSEEEFYDDEEYEGFEKFSKSGVRKRQAGIGRENEKKRDKSNKHHNERPGKPRN